MAIADSLLSYLEQKGISYKTHSHVSETSLSRLCFELGIEQHHIAVPVLLRSARNANLMAVIPLDHELDFERLAALLRRDFQYMDDSEIAAWFPDVEPGAEPPVPEAYSLPCILDRGLLDLSRIYFRAGSHACLVSVDQNGLQTLFAAYPKAVISNRLEVDASHSLDTGASAFRPIQQRLEQLHRLPAMPSMALNIIQLLASPATSAEELS